MSPVVQLRPEDLRVRRGELLDRAGTSLRGLEESARAYTLTPEERVIWDELETIRFLLAEDSR